VTDELDRMAAAVRTIAGIIRDEPGGSIAGIHLEGPFLNPAKKGLARRVAPARARSDRAAAPARRRRRDSPGGHARA
jgi:N-acetylglucosamine-6-phosphate deacetylase